MFVNSFEALMPNLFVQGKQMPEISKNKHQIICKQISKNVNVQWNLFWTELNHLDTDNA